MKEKKSIEFFGKVYTILSDLETFKMETIKKHVESKLVDAKASLKTNSEFEIAILAALNISNEYFKLNEEYVKLAKEYDKLKRKK